MTAEVCVDVCVQLCVSIGQTVEIFVPLPKLQGTRELLLNGALTAKGHQHLDSVERTNDDGSCYHFKPPML